METTEHKKDMGSMHDHCMICAGHQALHGHMRRHGLMRLAIAFIGLAIAFCLGAGFGSHMHRGFGRGGYEGGRYPQQMMGGRYAPQGGMMPASPAGGRGYNPNYYVQGSATIVGTSSPVGQQ
jgi:hypothetical protein